MRIGSWHFGLVALLASTSCAPAYDVQRPDKRLGAVRVTGRLIGYQEGDYAHAIVRTERGGEQSFFIDDEICFLASNRMELLAISYEEIERFFPEGRGYFPASVIRSISTMPGKQRWLREMSAKPTAAEQKQCARILRTTLVDWQRFCSIEVLPP